MPSNRYIVLIVFELFIGQNRELEVLNMSMCYGLGRSQLKWIIEGCSMLESWNLAWTELDAEAVQLICTSAPRSLRRINISGCRTTLMDESMNCCNMLRLDSILKRASSPDVLSLCQRCPNLVELDISDATCLTSTCASYIHDHLTRLEYLAMARCYNVQLSVFL